MFLVVYATAVPTVVSAHPILATVGTVGLSVFVGKTDRNSRARVGGMER